MNVPRYCQHFDNCRNNVIKLSFVNMTIEWNNFNVCKQLHIESNVNKVNMIDEIVDDDNISVLCITDSLDMTLTL